MQPNPIKSLLRSRKFLIAVLDVFVSSVLFFVGKYAEAMVFEDVQFLIGALQPVVIIIIAAIAFEDAAQKLNK